MWFGSPLILCIMSDLVTCSLAVCLSVCVCVCVCVGGHSLLPKHDFHIDSNVSQPILQHIDIQLRSQIHVTYIYTR
jgi:hypothetical protein